jgi:Protein of unknown function (DUF3800)
MVLIMLQGYIDESGTDESRLITLACFVGYDVQWKELKRRWIAVIDEKNAQLRKEGRTEITIFHATDWSTEKKEFRDWDPEEGKQFGAKLLSIINAIPLYGCGYTLHLDELHEAFPEANQRLYQLSHLILFIKIIETLSASVLSDARFLDEQLELINEGSQYNGVMQDTFETLKNDGTLLHRERLTTLTPKTKKECPLLQVADFFAYENYKAVEREPEFKRRFTLTKIIGADNFGGTGRRFLATDLRKFREHLDKNAGMKATYFHLAKISPRWSDP